MNVGSEKAVKIARDGKNRENPKDKREAVEDMSYAKTGKHGSTKKAWKLPEGIIWR